MNAKPWLLAALFASSMIVSPGHAASPLLNETEKTRPEALPPVAKRDSGITGVFNGKALDGPSISLTLPDGRTITAARQRIDEDHGKGRKSWVGAFEEQPGSIIVLTTSRGSTTGFVTYGAETWELMPGKAGRHVLYRVDDGKLSAVEEALHPEISNDQVATEDDFGTDLTSTSASGGYVHDLLVVYTPAARKKYGQATLESMIQNAVVAANQAYQNSKIAVTLNLVGLQEISYTESGQMKTSLYDLQKTSDGKLDAVHQLRNDLGADLVSLVSEDTSSCGIAWVMTSESTSFAANAFSVVRSSCLSQHSLAHELGHNQGNEHDRDSSSGYYGAYPYSYGFRRCVSDGTGFRTLMSYSCSGAARIAWFSNPNAYYNGYATGIAYETNPSKSADNSRSMTNVADTVAAFRAAKTTTGTLPSAPTGLTASSTTYNSVSLKWTDTSNNESGFKLQRSANGVDFVEIATLGANASSHVDNGVLDGRTYYYRVRAYNSLGSSGFSNTLSVTTPAATTTAQLAGFVLNRSTIAGCLTATGKVTLTAPAPAGGYPVTISENLANATTPSAITVPAGATAASFKIQTSAVSATQNGTVSVRAGSTLSRSLTVRPIGVQSMSLTSTSTVGGNSVGGTVKLECPAPAWGITASLASSSSTVAKPTASSITFSPGVQSRSITVRTYPVTASTKATIKGSANGVTKSVALTVNP